MARQETTKAQSPASISLSAAGISPPNAKQSYGHISEVLADLSAISSSVETKTGWKLDLSAVDIRVVTSRELLRQSLEDGTRRTGIPTFLPQSFMGRVVADAMLNLFHRSVVATHLRSEQAILLNEDRLKRVSQDGVKSILHHELTHVAQHQRYPEFMVGVDRLVREQILLGQHGGDLPIDERDRQLAVFNEKVQARMALVEGQAVELQRMYVRDAGLRPEVKTGPIEVALGLTSMLIPGGKDKIRQYIQGQAIFAKIYSLGAAQIDFLFATPDAADLVFGRRGKSGKVA